ETPVVSVSTSNPGATPESIETEVTDRVEAAVNTVAGIDELRSTSSEGSSRVTITFDLSKNPDIAAQEVRAKVDPVIRNLPETADPPVVQKQDPDATPIMMFSVSAPMSSVELTTFLEQNVQKRIESVNGVGEVIMYGARRRELQVKIDPDRLNAYALSTTDVAQALRAQNLELPGGRLEQGARELSVRTVGRLTRPQDFEDLVVATRGNSPIRIRDLGTVEDTGETPSSASMLNGKPAVSIAIRKQSGVNTVALADAIRARMDEIRATLPPTFEVRLIRDDSEFIRASLHAIEEHLILGGILAAIIVLLFLRSFRSTLIAAVAIPTSIIGAFSVMSVLGFTLNQMTMLALTLMVGIVIDDAIVVLENIYRFVEEKGMSPFQAAIEGTREIGLAVMATTLALLAVFVPVGFLGGIIGRFMSSFGLTAAAAIAISLIVSFTLTPMLAARWIKPVSEDHKGTDESRRGFYRHIDSFYTRLLELSLAHRWVVVGACAIVIASVYPLFKASGVNFTPDEDESRIQINARLPVGSSLAATQSLLDRVARDARALPGVSDTLAITGFGGGGGGSNVGVVFARLKPIDERELSQQELVIRARKMTQPYRPSARISVQGSSGIQVVSGRGAAIQYALVGPDLQRLDEYTAKAVELLDKEKALVDVDRSYLPGRPELRLDIDRKRAADLGVRVQDVSQTVNALVAGQDVTTFNAASDQYDVVLKAQDSFRRTPESIASATVRTSSGQLVQLRNLVNFDEGSGPASIDRLNRQRQITVTANPAPGVSQQEGQQALERVFDSLDMPPGYSLVTSGQSKELGRAAYYFGIAFLLSFVFMYMVLAAQFESFIHPITILLTLPIAVPFGLLASLMFGQTLNIYSALGVLLLFGIVKKNAILQID
ncbi:MAG TPA: efflux RND transporter permease subunit, partial [Vicinamibacterales bacterium]